MGRLEAPKMKAAGRQAEKTSKPATKAGATVAKKPPKQGPQEVNILVMGATGAGKSTFINLISGSALQVGGGLKSCTRNVQVTQTLVLGRIVTFIDTPGFDDTNVSNLDIVKTIAAYLSAHYERGKKVNGVIYLHRISDVRVGGTSRKNFEMVRKLCGEENFAHVAIVTTMWDEVDKKIAAARENQLKSDNLFFKSAIVRGAKTFRHDNTSKAARTILSYLVKKRQTSLRIQKELVDEKIDIVQTAVGRELQSELDVLIQKQKRELEEVKGDMAKAMATKDALAKQELEETKLELEEKLLTLRRDSEGLSSGYVQAKAEAAQHVSRFLLDGAPSYTQSAMVQEPMDGDAQDYGGACCIIM